MRIHSIFVFFNELLDAFCGDWPLLWCAIILLKRLHTGTIFARDVWLSPGVGGQSTDYFSPVRHGQHRLSSRPYRAVRIRRRRRLLPYRPAAASLVSDLDLRPALLGSAIRL